jgi:hypothetical protein
LQSFRSYGKISNTSSVRPRRTAPRDNLNTWEETAVRYGNEEEDSGDMSGSFESVKREAVQLERQLEDKIARFQQVRTW